MKSNIIYYSVLTLLLAVTSLTGCKEDVTYTEFLTTPSLKLEHAGDKEPDRFTVTITPNEYTKSYWYAIGTEADRESFENGTYVGLRKERGNGELSYTFTYLKPNSAYTVFALPFDGNDQPGTLSMITVKTDTDAFAVEMARVMAKSATITFSSTGDYHSYLYAVGKPEDKEAFENGTLSGIVRREEYTSYSATVFNLEPDTEYVFYGMGYDRLDQPTKVFEYPFRTLSADNYPVVTNQQVAISDLLFSNYQIEVNEHCSRVGLMIDRQGVRDELIHTFWGGRVLDQMDRWAQVGNLRIVGKGPVVNLEMQTTDLFLDKNPFDQYYDVYAVLYDKNNEPFSVEYFQYKTPSYDATAQPAVVETTVKDITVAGATYEFAPSENTMGFVFETFAADWYDASIANGSLTMEKVMEYLQMHFFYGNRPSFYIETTADHPGQRLYLIVGAINKNGFVNGMSELTVIEYTTLSN